MRISGSLDRGSYTIDFISHDLKLTIGKPQPRSKLRGRDNMTIMTKCEREDLQRLIRQREKVLKSAAKQRSAELLAEFENQMAASYQFDVDETWADVVRGVRSEMAKANARIADRCRKLGIPRDFAPGLEFHWRDRGANAV